MYLYKSLPVILQGYKYNILFRQKDRHFGRILITKRFSTTSKIEALSNHLKDIKGEVYCRKLLKFNLGLKKTALIICRKECKIRTLNNFEPIKVKLLVKIVSKYHKLSLFVIFKDVGISVVIAKKSCGLGGGGHYVYKIYACI